MGLKDRITGLRRSGWNGKSDNDHKIPVVPDNSAIARDMIFKAFSSAPMPMAINNLESGIYVDVNDTFLNTLGYKKDEIIGHTSDDIQVFADIEESNKYIRLLSKFKKVTDFQINLRKKNGD